jgi:uncharacterized coiled-coil DUF342 family protein
MSEETREVQQTLFDVTNQNPPSPTEQGDSATDNSSSEPVVELVSGPVSSPVPEPDIKVVQVKKEPREKESAEQPVEKKVDSQAAIKVEKEKLTLQEEKKPVENKKTKSPQPTTKNQLPKKPLTSEEQKKLFAELDVCGKDVSELRDKLNALSDKKEAAFGKKNKVSGQIKEQVDDVKGSKSERDRLTKLVKESKKRRGDLNTEMRNKIEEIKKLNAQKKEIMQKHNIQGDPSRLKKEIEELDYTLETEVLSPTEEKKLTKLIKGKKKVFNEAKDLSTIFDRVHELSKEIDKLKYKCDETHRKIQTRASTSQEKHQSIVETSKDIDELRKKEKEEFQKALAIKRDFNQVNEELKVKLKLLADLRMRVGSVKKAKAKKRQTQEKRELSERKKAAEEKFATKKKLTTEDLIAMRG